MKKHFTSAGVALMITAVFTSISADLSAQCKGFVNKQITTLSPFIFQGKPNSTVLMPGDHSELALTFYSGQTYRIIMKTAQNTGKVAFTIKDSKGNLVFKSNSEQQADYYDFTSETTQLLTVEMEAAENIITASVPTETQSQCVVVMVGQKE